MCTLHNILLLYNHLPRSHLTAAPFFVFNSTVIPFLLEGEIQWEEETSYLGFLSGVCFIPPFLGEGFFICKFFFSVGTALVRWHDDLEDLVRELSFCLARTPL